MNVVALMGRLTADPELKDTRDSCYTRFTLAVNRIGSEDADFISCVAFGKTADLICKYMAKGRQLAVWGRIQTGSYKNQQDGRTVYTTDVVVQSMEFCGSGAGQNDRPAERADDRRPAPDRTYGGNNAQRQDDRPSERTLRRHEAERRMQDRRRQYADAPEGFVPERDGFNDLPFT